MLMQLPDPTAQVLSGALLGHDVALLVWQGAAWKGRFRPLLDGAALRPPLLAAGLAGTGWQAGLARLPDGAAAGARLDLGGAEDAAPGLAIGHLAPDPRALLAALPAPAQAALLRLLLDAATGLFRGPEDAGVAPLLHELALMDAGEAPEAQPVAVGPEGLHLLRTDPPRPAGQVFLVGPRRVLRLAAAANADTHLLVPTTTPGEVLVAEAGWARRVVAPAGELPALLDRLAAGGADAGAIRVLLPALLDRRAGEPAVAELLHAARCLAPARPRSRPSLDAAVTGALEMALPDAAGGLFLRGWLRDPHRLVTGMRLGIPGQPGVPLEDNALFRFPRRELGPRFRRAAHAPGEGAEGFVAHLPRAACGPQPDLTLHLAGGGSVVLTPALRTLAPAQARDAVLASVRGEALTEVMFEKCLAPAATRLHAAHLALPRTPLIRRFGTPPASPRVSVLVPLYRNLGFLRVQIAAFAADPEWRHAETIIVLDSPEQAGEAEHLLRGIHLMHGVPIVLVVPPRNLGYAAANNLGAECARGRLLLLLNSDVVPDQPGWLGRLAAAAMAKGAGAAGPKLLFEDGSIQHAGLFFERDAEGRWLNRHYFKGFPRRYPPAERARAVPGVTGAALMVRHALFEKVGGITEDYIVGDYEDSDLCLKLRQAGAGITYEPAAELWHFERRSIGLHAGYTATLAGQYNRALHHRRWDRPIGTLMRRFAPELGA